MNLPPGVTPADPNFFTPCAVCGEPILDSRYAVELDAPDGMEYVHSACEANLD